MMKKKLILVAAPPACGKNYVSELLCRSLDGVAYFDKDELSPLLRCAFEVCGERVDMDGEFYKSRLRPYEYETLLGLAFGALRFSSWVVVNAPFLSEVHDESYMKRLKARTAAEQAELILVWVHAPLASVYERMKARNAVRDQGKLCAWEDYVRATDFRVPHELEDAQAVDRLIVLDNENEETARASLSHLLSEWGIEGKDA
jgi:predicted kinase